MSNENDLLLKPPSKQVRIGGDTFTFAGLSEADPYFRIIADGMEESFYTLVRKYVHTDSIAIDVGANVGVTSLLLSRHLAQGKVFSFEPSPKVFSLLSSNIRANGAQNVIAVNRAIGAAQSEMRFADYSAYGHLIEASTLGHGAAELTIAVTTLDDFVNDAKLSRVDFVKIDVEGFESDVLHGMKDTVNKYSPLIYFEFNSWCQIAFKNENPRHLLDYVIDQFKYVYFFGPDRELVRLEHDNAIHFLHENLVRHGCVDDLLATNDAARIELSGSHLRRALDQYIVKRDRAVAERDRAVAERDRAVAERDRAVAERDALLSSTSWKLTAPLRALKKMSCCLT